MFSFLGSLQQLTTTPEPKQLFFPSTAALLPPELLLLIFEYAGPANLHTPSHRHLLKRELCHYALVCSAWLGPARQMLYHHIEIKWSFTRATPLLRTFENRQPLRRLVTSFSSWGLSRMNLFLELGLEFQRSGALERLEEEMGTTDVNHYEEQEMLNGAVRSRLLEQLERHPDALWARDDFSSLDKLPGARGAEKLHFLLQSFPNLARLALFAFHTPLPFPPPNAIDTISRLSFLALNKVSSTAAHSILSRSTHIKTLDYSPNLISYNDETPLTSCLSLSFPVLETLRIQHDSYSATTPNSLSLLLLSAVGSALHTLVLHNTATSRLEALSKIPCPENLRRLFISGREKAIAASFIPLRDFLLSASHLEHFVISSTEIATLLPFLPSTLITIVAEAHSPATITNRVTKIIEGSRHLTSIRRMNLYYPDNKLLLVKQLEGEWKKEMEERGVGLEIEGKAWGPGLGTRELDEFLELWEEDVGGSR